MFSDLHLDSLSACVHCGFCLQSCPTFLVTSDEADSPRGRIVLMQQLKTETDPALRQRAAYHIDRCIGCRACEPACPSGVAYGAALEEVSACLALERPLPMIPRAVLFILGDDLLRRPVLRFARALRRIAGWFKRIPLLGFPAALLAQSRPRFSHSHLNRSCIGSGEKGPFTLFRGCIMDGLFAHVHGATLRTLGIQGFRLVETRGQTCCGALHAHAGKIDEARALAARNVRAFATVPGGGGDQGQDQGPIVVNAAGCGAMLKGYPELLAGTPLETEARRLSARVLDITEILDCSHASRGKLELRVAYDPPCHLLHAQAIAEQPLALLQAVPGLELVSHAESELCCGSGGTYAVREPRLSREVLDRKVDALITAGVEAVATGNPGCIMQLGAGLALRNADIPVVHPVELLDLAYDRAGLYSRSRDTDRV